MPMSETRSLADRLHAAADVEHVYEPCSFAGRGIVICAGGSRLFTCAWLLIAFLRRELGCTLPIEVWHIGPEELGQPMRALLEALDAQTIDSMEVARQHPVTTLGGWQLKTYALLHCRFQEVLLLDADNLPVSDPAFLFDAPEYSGSGAMFWPDMVRLRPGNPIWAISGLPADAGPSFESGQLLIDKARHWNALNLAHWINQHHLLFDEMLYGDKDAFYVAWRKVGRGFYLIPHLPRRVEHTLCQRAPDGRVLFQHRSGAKWLLHGPNPKIDGFRFEEQCLTLLGELQLLWDGTIFNPPERSLEARAIERSLAQAGAHRLIWLASHERVVTFLPAHRLEGCGGTEWYWFVRDGASGPVLCISGLGNLSCALPSDGHGIWRGPAGQFSMEIRPAEAGRPASVQASAATEAWLEVTDGVLQAGSRHGEQAAEAMAHVITLATLAALNDAVVAHLKACAADRRGSSSVTRLAVQALERHAANGAPISPKAVAPGTGWRSYGIKFSQSSEAIPRR